MNWFKIFIQLSVFGILLLSCKNNNTLVDKKRKFLEVKSKEKPRNENIININTLKALNLPFGEKEILSKFPKTWKIANNDVSIFDDKLSDISNALSTYWDSVKTTKSDKITQKTTDFLECSNNYLSFLFSFKLDEEKEKQLPLFALPMIKGYTPIIASSLDSKTQKRVYLYIINDKGVIMDGINIRYKIDGDMHSSERIYYIDDDGIIHLKSFTYTDDEIIQEGYMKYYLSKNGKIVRYFENKSELFQNDLEKGQIIDNKKNGEWIETIINYYVQEKTYLEANYKNGIPIGNWKYYSIEYDLTDSGDEIIKGSERKGKQLLMTENYSLKGKLLKREILK